MEKVEYIKNLQELASSVQPLNMINHSEKCEKCKIILLKAQAEIVKHMNEND